MGYAQSLVFNVQTFGNPGNGLDCGAYGLKLVMGVESIHVGRGMSGELLTKFLGHTRIRQSAVK